MQIEKLTLSNKTPFRSQNTNGKSNYQGWFWPLLKKSWKFYIKKKIGSLDCYFFKQLYE